MLKYIKSNRSNFGNYTPYNSHGTVFNIKNLKRYIKDFVSRADMFLLIMCLICSAISAGVAFVTIKVFGRILGNLGNPDSMINGGTIALGISVVAAAVAYIIPLLLIKGLSKDDLEMIPKGEKIAKRLEKYGFLG